MRRIFVQVGAVSVGLCAACSGPPPAAMAPPATATAATPAAAIAQPAGGALRNFATITQSASTNTPGLVIVVRADGTAVWDTAARPGQGVRPSRRDHGEVVVGALAKTLLDDIPSDVHLADLPVQSCSKPASFGTTTTLDHFGDQSGDLSCPATDPRTKTLARDVEAVGRAVLAACGQ